LEAVAAQVRAYRALADRSLDLHGMQEVRGSNPLSSTIFRIFVRV
jgi:hypothetical protein